MQRLSALGSFGSSVHRLAAVLLACFALIGCAQTQLAAHVASVSRPEAPRDTYKVGKPYTIKGITYTPREDMSYDRTGIASWYGPGFHGRRTPNGEIYDSNALTAAHPTLQMPSVVRVTNLENGRSVDLRINDRGPFADNRIIDVSKRAAELLGFRKQGTAMVRVQILPEETLAVVPVREAARIRSIAANQPQTLAQNPVVSPPVSRADQPANRAGPLTPVHRPSTTPPGSTTPNTTSPTGTVMAGLPVPVGRPSALGGVQLASAQGATLAPAVAPAEPRRWYVQTGAFMHYDNAKRLGTQLTSLGRVEIQALDVADGPIYRVRMGPFASQDEATVLAQAVGNAGINDTRVMVD